MKYTKEILKEAAASSTSMAGMMRILGISHISGSMHQHLKKMIIKYDIDTSHWTGKCWNKGKYAPRRTIEQILIRKTKKEKTRVLLLTLLKAGIPYKCNCCGLGAWNGKFIRLHVEHKDGNNLNDRIENLELLCPNCHSQTSTYGVLKKDRHGNNGNSYIDRTKKEIASAGFEPTFLKGNSS